MAIYIESCLHNNCYNSAGTACRGWRCCRSDRLASRHSRMTQATLGTFPTSWTRADTAVGSRTDEAAFHGGPFSGVKLGWWLTMRPTRIASWWLIFHCGGTWHVDFETKLERAILLSQLFAPAPRERRRLWMNISKIKFHKIVATPHLDNAFSRKSSPKRWAAARWTWCDFALASCQTTYRRRAWDLEGWWTLKNQLWNSSRNH